VELRKVFCGGFLGRALKLGAKKSRQPKMGGVFITQIMGTPQTYLFLDVFFMVNNLNLVFLVAKFKPVFFIVLGAHGNYQL